MRYPRTLFISISAHILAKAKPIKHLVQKRNILIFRQMHMLMPTNVNLMNSLILTSSYEVYLSDDKGVVCYICVVDNEGRKFRYVDLGIQLLLGIMLIPI